ncbi:MAG TPA: histone deacetylase [Flavobacteriales bacterium]|nr:histone deacetylase [Flavobacteriales bacterium]
MRVAYHPSYSHPLPMGHRFPMAKYELLAGQLQHEGLVETTHWLTPTPIECAAVFDAHDADYIDQLEKGLWSRKEELRSGFPWSLQLIEREKIIMEGTRQCAQWAAQGHVALNIAGGTHHACRGHAEGFCLLNDLAISAYDLISAGLERILIIDLDVHQGNGTAHITGMDSRIFTFSMHGAKNYPMKKPPSSLDISLPDGTKDRPYLRALKEALDHILPTFDPQVALYQCGVDVLESDKLGRLSMSLDGCAERDALVLMACQQHGIGVACAMGGGYSEDTQTIVKAHMNTFRTAREIWT